MPEIDQSRAFVPINIAILTVSDTRTLESDKSGDLLKERIEGYGHRVVARSIVKDEIEVIQTEVKQWIESPNIDVVISTGGTGLTGRDVTPEALDGLIERKIPGIEEAIRSYGQERTPYAMLSRSVVGTIANTLVIAIPGSTKGAAESMDAVFPSVLHVFGIFKGARHD